MTVQPAIPELIPIIDISALLDGDFAAKQAVASQIGQACRSIGFFYVKGHGVPSATIADVFSASASFFSAPEPVKKAVAFSGPWGNRGYISVGGESLDPGQLPDLKETFNIGLELDADDPEVLAGKLARVRNLWPAIPGFREVMLAYYEKMGRLAQAIHRAFAIDLSLPPSFFDDKFRKPMTTLRLLHYPQSVPKAGTDQKGAGTHTDYGNITLLATDKVGGLMVQDRNGQWIDAPVIEGAFVCNIGDCLMRWTNDVYVSTPHKVETPPGKERYSVAYFVDPDPDAIVSCLPTCVEDGRHGKYPAVTAADYLRSRLEPTYAHNLERAK